MPGIFDDERRRDWRIWARPKGLAQVGPQVRRNCSKVDKHFLALFSCLPTISQPMQTRVLIPKRP